MDVARARHERRAAVSPRTPAHPGHQHVGARSGAVRVARRAARREIEQAAEAPARRRRAPPCAQPRARSACRRIATRCSIPLRAKPTASRTKNASAPPTSRPRHACITRIGEQLLERGRRVVPAERGLGRERGACCASQSVSSLSRRIEAAGEGGRVAVRDHGAGLAVAHPLGQRGDARRRPPAPPSPAPRRRRGRTSRPHRRGRASRARLQARGAAPSFGDGPRSTTPASRSRARRASSTAAIGRLIAPRRPRHRPPGQRRRAARRPRRAAGSARPRSASPSRASAAGSR